MRRSIMQSTAWIGLITAVLGLGTTVGVMYSANQQAQAEAKKKQDDYEHRLKVQREEIERIRLAAERERICNGHASTLQQIDAGFNNLLDRHGVLLSLMRACGRDEDEDARGKCLAAICLGAAVMTGGDSNCMSVITEAGSFHERAQAQAKQAASQQCTLKRADVLTYFDDPVAP